MLPIFSSSTSLAPFSASEIEIEIASNHPGAPGVKTGQTRKTSFLIPHHTCYPVTEDKGGRVQTQKERRFKSYRRDSVQVIYQYLDENKSLILKIIESQNTGKLSECAECLEHQRRKHLDLMCLMSMYESELGSHPIASDSIVSLLFDV